MNLREGTRRLALLLGAVGAILGGFISYLQLQSTMRQRADYLRWMQLANSPVVKQTHHDGWIDVDPNDFLADAQPLSTTVNKDGVAVIHWTKSLEVASIETQDGQTLYPRPAPGAWSYGTVAILPLLGFFVPWGAVRAVGWVASGFVASPR